MRFRRKPAREAEWAALKKQEDRFLLGAGKERQPVLNRQLERFVPDRLSSTLDLAFCKAFELVFEKGTGVIEKTYHKENREMAYKVNAYAVGLKESRKNLKAFSKNAKNSKAVNLLASGASGMGLGVLGIGLPDIPLFTGMILKAIYELALSYGFTYDTAGEQCFILRLIRTPLLSGEERIMADEGLNRMITGSVSLSPDQAFAGLDKKEEIRLTAEALSHELLYMKFLQGIPVAGVIGGMYDAVYMKKITDYAEMKYKRRFLERICR
ncbi:EcsC family protein [Clostridiales bacterium TF09-2AC]|uniref:EcsC family protein n=1 Tax=Enterocloster hominis (ex Hitch et al. 2024) TaxID=1917870 RepID=A0ABV1D9L8_9FIRM|nr:hypothetical protein CBFG_04007 [Clostridiales bacterium 1_7_47FAA]RJW33823.1 EcsC family protein [Clostridiales bacterium TF09-2AC]